MKKIKLEINRTYRLPDPNISNQLRLKKIYDSSFNYSREKSPRNSIKKEHNNRYGVLTDRKLEQTRKSKYQAYLQSQFIKPKHRPNRRYQKKLQSDRERQRESVGYSAYLNEPIQRRRPNGESVDMFKIRKTKQKLEEKKVISVSHSKINQPLSIFEEAKQLYKKSKFKQALQIFNSCIQTKPDRPEYQYYSAICYLNLHNYELGYKLLQKLCYSMPNFKKSAFLFAAISAKHLQKYKQAFKLCSEGLNIHPNYNDLLAYRAKLFQMKNDYQSAHKDYQTILKTDKSNVEILIKDADCLYKMKSYTNCLSNLSAALYADRNNDSKIQILNKRIEVNLQLNNLKDVKKDLTKLEQVMGMQKQCSKLLFVKGLVLQKQGKKKQAILCYEECLKVGTQKQAMARSLVEITKNKINERDFYSAFYHISRSVTLQLESDEIQIYRLFSQGVVYLMKRKIKQGDQNLEKIIEKYPKLTEYLKKIYYLYRAFAKFSLSDYQQAIKDYETANKQQPIDIYATYNKLLAEGILMIQKQRYEDSVKFLNQAEKVLSFTDLNRIEAYLYRAASHINKAKKFMKIEHQMEQLKSLQQIFTALKELDKAYDINDSNSNMLYFRSLIYLYLGKFQQAQQDIIKAISKSEQNVAKYFFFRGLTHASLGNNKQALNDFSICTNLDQTFHLVYLQRAKINFEAENVTKGLADLVKLKSLHSNQDISYHETCLNYVHGHYIMANQACDGIADPAKAKQMKILIKLKLGKVKQVKKIVQSAADKMICDILLGNTTNTEIASNQLEYFQLYHYHHYMGVMYFKKQNYEEAIDMFVMAAKERNLLDLEQGIANPSLSEIIDQQNESQNSDSEKQIINKINYNIFLCHLLNKQYKKAYEVFIRDIISVKQSLLKNQFIAGFSHALFQSISCSVEPQQKEIYELTIFQAKIDKLSESLLIELPTLFIKTKLCYLTIHNHKLMKQYSPKADPDFIIQYINLGEIENKPQPPWVKRQDSGLIFTDQITNINIQFMTTQNNQQDEEEDDEDEQNSEEQEQQEREDDESNVGENNFSVNKFKQKMKLGDSIERKLQMIMQKKKKRDESIEFGDQ